MRRLLLAIVLSLAFVQPASADTVDLISLVDLNQDVVNGNWQLVNGELIADETPAARINFPYRPPLEYDYTVEFTLTSGANPWGNIAQLSSHGDVPFAWSTNAGTGHYCRLEDINGHSVIGNPTLVYYPFVGGQRYTSIVRVRNDRVICEIDGQKLVEYETDYSDLSRNQKWEMPDQLNIALGGYAGEGATTTFHSARVTPFTNLNDGLILHYEFEGNADDSSPSGFDGTEFGGIAFVEGVKGHAASFDGVDDYIDVGTSLGGYSAFSLFAWVKLSTVLDQETLVSASWYRSDALGGDGGFQLAVNVRSNIHYRSWVTQPDRTGHSVLDGPGDTALDQWYLIGFTWDGLIHKMYLDGVEVNSESYTGYMGHSAKNTLVGASLKVSNIINFFNGAVDDLRIYNRALTEAEIQELYSLPPIANAGDDQTVDEGVTVILDGSKSSDPNNDIVSYLWEQIDGPSVTLTDDDKVQATFTAPDVDQDSVLTLQLTVTDNDGMQDTDTCVVTVKCVPNTYYRDSDGDGYGDPGNSTEACSAPSGYVIDNTDCDDTDPLEHPGQTWYKDYDNDGYSEGTTDTASCIRPPGYKVESELTATSGDCNDGDSTIHPGASEVCNGKDDDCDGSIDEGVTNTYYRDADGDSYGDPSSPTQACSLPIGYVTNDLDCDDTDPNEHPNQTWYKDADSDGYSDGVVNSASCTRPTGYRVVSELIAISGDCDDNDQNQNPGAPEICNEEDDDCDGETDEGCIFNKAPDADAGSNQTVDEGRTVTLDGSNSSDPDGDTISYQWTQLGGIPVTLSDPTAAKPTFVTPIVSPGGMILTFELVVKDDEDLQDSAQVIITVDDNGIDGFPDDVLTMTCSTGKEIGIKVESDLVSITAVDPATIPDSSDKPDNLPYGLFDLLIKADAVGGTAKVTFYLESQAGNNDKWSKHKTSTGKWEDCSAYAVFNAAKDQVTLTLVDGGDGDDGPADGWIVDRSGLSSSASTTSSGGGGGGGGGCFIDTAADG